MIHNPPGRYIDRLTALQELLNNPPQDISAETVIDEVSILILDLWFNYKDDKDLQMKLGKLITQNPKLIPKLELHLNELLRTDLDKDSIDAFRQSLRNINLEIEAAYITYEQQRKGYTNRITALQELLDNPPRDISAEKAIDDASILILDLWFNYKNDKDLQMKLGKLITQNPKLIPKLELHLNELLRTDLDKDSIDAFRQSLRNINLEIEAAYITYEQQPKIKEDLSQDHQLKLDIVDNSLLFRIKLLKILLVVFGLIIVAFAWFLGVGVPALILVATGLWILLNNLRLK